MAFDQKITYRVNVDDSDFQAKLSSMRASLDMSLGGGNLGGMGGMGSFGAMMAPSGGYGAGAGGMSDWGSQIRPVSYTPAAIAMQPHFGMFAVQQTFAQSAAGMFGPAGAGAYSARDPIMGAMGGAFVGGVFGGPAGAVGGALFGGALGGMGMNFSKDVIPQNISAAEYQQMSARSFGTRIGDAASTAALVGASTAASLFTGGVGALVGTAVGGPVGGFVGSMIGGMIPSALENNVSDMMANNRSIQTTLESGSFRFLTGGKDVDPVTGRGFGRRARADIADSIQSLELKDVRFGMGEMKQVLESGMQLDMFSGTQDAEGFKSKFKGLVENLKTITATLHTSLKEGVEVIRGFRDMGVTDPSEINRLTMRSETLGRASGKTGMEMMAIGQTGAEMFRGTGVNMELGFQLNQQNAATVNSLLRNAPNTDVIRQAVSQMGGEAGAAQQMTGSALAFTQTAFGRGMLMAGTRFGQQAPDVSKMAGQDAMSIMSQAGGMSAMGIMNFQARQHEIIGGMSATDLQMLPLAGYMAQARTLGDAFGAKTGKDYENVFRSTMIRNGVSPDQVEINIGMLNADPEKIRAERRGAIDKMGQQASLEDARNTYGFKAVGNWFGRTVTQPLQRIATGISTDIAEGAENAVMRLMGGTVADTSSTTAASVKRGTALLAGPSNEGSVSDASISVWDRAVGGQSGQPLAEALMTQGTAGVSKDGRAQHTFMGGTALEFGSEKEVQDYASKTHGRMQILSDVVRGKDGQFKVLAIEARERDNINKTRKMMEVTSEDLKTAESYKLSDDKKMQLEAMAEHGETSTLAGVGQALFGSKFDTSKISGTQHAVLSKVLHESGLTGARATLESMDGGASTDASIRDAGDAANKSRKATTTLGGQMHVAMGAGGLIGMLSGKGDAGAFAEKLDIDQMKLVSDLSGASTDTERRKIISDLRSSGVKEKDIESLKSFASAMPEKQRQEIAKQVQNIDKLNTQSHLAKSSIQAGDKTAVGGPLGEISQETLKQMNQMAIQLNQSMEKMISMQKEWQALTKKGQQH